ncbi:type VI secretion system membrane subunit TssM [Alkalilimnicola sp. S0819]|uniref:type VI secretion system membrane subunit TssM n=1 Tax=Alkalilimnicola sp. S0819 TaxID=2613922 RepID=UPI00186A76D1|nr:type VI secretion system membrane subunit TssM [Alkalilimnicola sp. S0819]
MLKRIGRRRAASRAPEPSDPPRRARRGAPNTHPRAANPLARGLEPTLAALSAAGLARGAGRLPWYLLIGLPDVGKSRLLAESGLRFTPGAESPAPIGGANPDARWWLAEEAVYIDLAGRYTSQANPDVDEGEDWRDLLHQLRRRRAAPALNGVILTVALDSFMAQTPTERAAQAATLRRRVQELNSHLRLDLPVYLLFTRLDRFPGFNEFFARLDGSERAQPWGVRLPLADSAAESFPEACTALLQRAEQAQLERLHAEPSLAHRRQIHGFPRRMLALTDELQVFLQEIVAPTRFEQGAILRGVYFLSARPACFIERVLREQLPADRDLAAEDGPRRQRRKRRRQAGWVALAASFLIAVTALGVSHQRNSDWLGGLDTALAGYREPPAPHTGQGTDWVALAGALDQLRRLPGGFAQGTDAPWLTTGFGLYEGERLGPAAAAAYRRGLRHLLLPALTRAMEARLRGDAPDEEALYETLRHYLMLHRPAHQDAASIQRWAEGLWARSLLGAEHAQRREALQEHLAAALADALEPPPADARAIALAREGLARTSLERRVYRRLKQEYLQKNPAEFSLRSVLGDRAQELFTRRSGASLARGVPAFYSYEAFHGSFQLQSRQLARKLAEERWIYGDNADAEPAGESLDQLAGRVQALYFQGYIAHWRAFLEDLRLRGFRGTAAGAQRYARLAGDDAPLQRLLARIRRHTALDQLPDTVTETATLAAGGAERLPEQAAALSQALPAVLPGAPVAQAFATFNHWAAPGAGSPLAGLQQSLVAAADHLAALDQALDPGELALRALAAGGGAQMQGFARAAQRAPAPVRAWFASLRADGTTLTRRLARARLNALWQAEVLTAFRPLADRYPLRPDAPHELSLRDFAAFFGPGGRLEQYYQRHLTPLVRERGDSLQWRVASGIPQETLMLFQRARAVRRDFFDAAGAPRVAFTLRPRRLAKAALGVTLDHGEQRLEYRHGPRRAQRLYWPTDSEGESRLVFQLASRTLPLSTRTEGPWSWYRMLERHGRLNPEGDGWLLALELDGVEAQFELRPEGRAGANLGLLRGFTLPERL